MSKNKFALQVKSQLEEFSSPSGTFARLDTVLPVQDVHDNVTHYLGDRQDDKSLVVWSQYRNTDAALLEKQKAAITKCMQMKDSRFYTYEEAWISDKTGQLNLVTRHHTGYLFSSYLKNGRHLKVNQVQSYMRQLVESVDFFHAQGMTLGDITCDQILKCHDQIYLVARNQRIQSTDLQSASYVAPNLEEVQAAGTVQGDIRSLAGVLIQLFSREKLTEKELADMKQNGTIPEIVDRINDKATRDFIINACIRQKNVTKVADLKKHSFLQSYTSLASYWFGNQQAAKYCKDLMKVEKLNLDEINLLEKEAVEADSITQISRLEFLPEEQKHSGAKETILDHLIKLEKDPRKEIEAFEGVLDIPIGKTFSKFAIEDETGAVSYRKQEGTAFVVDMVSDLAVVLQSVAHNFFYFKKTSSKYFQIIILTLYDFLEGTTMKEAVECIYLYQNIGDKHNLKFNVIKFQPMVNHKVTQTFTDGSDFCLAIGIVDTNDSSYSPEKMKNLKIIERTEFPFQPNEQFAALRFGYPNKVFDFEKLGMEPNYRVAPYVSGGTMHYELCNQGDSGILLYKEVDVFASEGDSGSIIIVEKDNKKYIAGHHAGILDGQGYGSALTINVQIDNNIPYVKENIKSYNRTEEDLAKYSASVDEFCKQIAQKIEARELEKAEVDLGRKEKELAESLERSKALKIKKRLRVMGLDKDVGADEDLSRLKKEIEEDNPHLNNLIGLFSTLPNFKQLEDGDEQAESCIEFIMKFLEIYLSVDNINIEHQLATGQMKVARDPAKDFAIVPFDTNIRYGVNKGDEFIRIVSG